MTPRARVLVTGHNGFLGSATARALLWAGYAVETWRRRDYDLRSLSATSTVISAEKPDAVVHLAYPGGDGIGDALAHPASLASDLLRMDMNVIEACAKLNVPKLVCIGSVCAYPNITFLPTDEGQLWNGYPEPVNASYGIVKRAQLALLQAHRQEFGLNGIHLILPNLYGPGDRSGHVIPALIGKIRQAQQHPYAGPVVVWGGPAVTRSFLYIEDAAEGIVRALAGYDAGAPLNLVNNTETSIAQLAEMLAYTLDYTGEFVYDTTKPTGHVRRQFSTGNMERALGWLPSTTLKQGLEATVAWHQEHIDVK